MGRDGRPSSGTDFSLAAGKIFSAPSKSGGHMRLLGLRERFGVSLLFPNMGTKQDTGRNKGSNSTALTFLLLLETGDTLGLSQREGILHCICFFCCLSMVV